MLLFTFPIDKVKSKHAKEGQQSLIFATVFCLIRQCVVSPPCLVTNSPGFQLIDFTSYIALLTAVLDPQPEPLLFALWVGAPQSFLFHDLFI